MEKLLFETASSSAAETSEAGGKLASLLLSDSSLPSYITLNGELGAGKTEFTRGFAAITSPGSRVKSPTYTLVNSYTAGKRPVYHLDVYRIKDDDDLYSTGYYDYPEDAFFLVEWASVISYALPPRYISVDIDKTEAPDSRHITVKLHED